MYYYKARIYSPTLGRFMQTDPIGYKDQMNLYGYVGNDPINNVDPDGKEKIRGAMVRDRMWKEALAETQKSMILTQSRPRTQTSVPEKAPKISSQAGSTMVGGADAVRGAISRTAEVTSKSPDGLWAVKGSGGLLTAVAAGVDYQTQVNGGKPGDEAAVNVGSKAAFSSGVAYVAGIFAPETAGGSAAVAAAVIGADWMLGGKIGDGFESGYKFLKSNAPPPQYQDPHMIIYP